MLGQAPEEALGEKRGIRRFGQALVPMDEALVEAAIDLSGRPPFLEYNFHRRERLGGMETELFREFFCSTRNQRGAHAAPHPRRRERMRTILAEAAFKAAARALRMAVERDPQDRRCHPFDQGKHC